MTIKSHTRLLPILRARNERLCTTVLQILNVNENDCTRRKRVRSKRTRIYYNGEMRCISLIDHTNETNACVKLKNVFSVAHLDVSSTTSVSKNEY